MHEDNSSTLVIDTGSWLTKAGLSNEDNPRVISPTVCGKTKDSYYTYFGQDAISKRHELETKNLVIKGKPTDWDDLENYWNNICVSDLQLDMSERTVLTSYYHNTNKQCKEKTMQIFFESFKVPFYYTSSNSLLTLYSSGKLNGIVLDSGDQLTSVVPFYDGTPINYAQVNTNFGGHNITQYLASLLKMDAFQARDIKEKYCRISMDCEKEVDDLNRSNDPAKVTLPDNREIFVRDWAVKSCEGLFDPSAIRSSNPGIQELIYECILKTDFDLRREFMANMVVTGGNTNFYYFNERLTKELGTVLPTILKVKISNISDRVNSTWLGGAIVSSLSTFQPLMISRSEYDEVGPSIVSRKCV